MKGLETWHRKFYHCSFGLPKAPQTAVRTAKILTWMLRVVGPNVVPVDEPGVTDMRMTPAELRQSRAKVAIYMIRMYYHDLSEYYAGDEGRFNRMVVDGGKGLPTAHPHGWAQHIVNCTTAEAVEFNRDELVAIYQQLIAWHLVAVAPPGLDEAVGNE